MNFILGVVSSLRSTLRIDSTLRIHRKVTSQVHLRFSHILFCISYCKQHRWGEVGSQLQLAWLVSSFLSSFTHAALAAQPNNCPARMPCVSAISHLYVLYHIHEVLLFFSWVHPSDCTGTSLLLETLSRIHLKVHNWPHNTNQLVINSFNQRVVSSLATN